MMRYAQINNAGVCFSVSLLSGEVDAPNMILIGDDESPIGMKWDDGQWVEVPAVISSAQNILSAPAQGFGGPSIKELFNGNR